MDGRKHFKVQLEVNESYKMDLIRLYGDIRFNILV